VKKKHFHNLTKQKNKPFFTANLANLVVFAVVVLWQRITAFTTWVSKTTATYAAVVIPAVVLIGVALVYAASIDRTVVVSEELHIIPGSVISEGWNNPEYSLTREADDYASWSDFSGSQAASLIPDELNSAPVVEQSVPDQDSQTVDSETATTETVVAEDVLPTDEDVPQSSSISEPEATPEVAPEPVQEPETVEIESSSVPESEEVSSADVSYFVPERATALPFLQLIVDEEIASEQPQLDTELVADEVSSNDETTVSEVDAENVSDDTSSPFEPSSETVDEVGEGDLSVSESPSATDATSIETSTETEVTDVEIETTDEVVEVLPTIFDECAAQLGCVTQSLVYSNFSVPELERGTKIDNAQLHLSLAAKTIDTVGIQRLVVEYSYDEGSTWAVSTYFDIEDEISNATNGGYFLVSLPQPRSEADINRLSVRVSYQGDKTFLEGVYVESVWLEVTSLEFYEDESLATLDDITYERNLLQPKFHSLHSEGVDLSLGTLPSFTMSYDPQEGFLQRIFTDIFSDNTYEVTRLTLRDAYGDVISLPYSVDYIDETTWTVRLERMPQKLRPGRYTVELQVTENGEIYVDSFEFYWGVLAVNTTKSQYFKDEPVTFNLAALTDRGDTICDAHLELTVIDPDNNINEVTVEQSGECGDNNVTDIPDYLATYTDTDLYGKYTIQLVHRNREGEMVHRVEDSFMVAEYIPFDITRTAPTRIYPPAPYEVTLDIVANRSFTGDIVERVPRGFVFADVSGAEVTTLEEATLLTWKDVTLEVGDTLTLSYIFDAPDISPYMYLLGPLDMDGFQELRQWQIASDAISSVAILSATQSELGTNLNDATPAALLWSTSTVDDFYFSHSTSTNPERLTVAKDGDYAVSVTLPLERNDTANAWSRVGFEVRVNGAVVPQAIGRSGLIYNVSSGGNRQNQSSSHGNFLLTNLTAGDYIEVHTQALSNYVAQPVTITGEASLYVEHLPATTPVFAATATSTVSSTTLNTSTAAELRWIETRQDSGFTHSDSVTPEDIILADPGAYLVYINVPMNATGTSNPYRNVLGRVLLDGTEVPGGVFSQGTIIVTANNDFNSSSHWSGVVVSTTSNQVISISMEREAAAGNVAIPTGFFGSVLIQKIPTEDVIALRGRDMSAGTNWNVDPAQTILWDTQLAYDGTVFSHSTTTDNDDITINEGGDYLLVYNDALVIAGGTNNVVIDVRVNGTPVSGAQTKTHYTSNSGGQQDSSGSLTIPLEGLTPGDIVSVSTQRDANTTVADDRTDAMLLLWKKKELNFRPGAPTMYGVPFDNIRFASTTPQFEFTASDPDGTSNLVYEFSISTTSDFSSAVTRVSDTDVGFENLDTPADTSPFTENEQIRFHLQPADSLSDDTYYWRVRAKDLTGSNEFGDWSTTQSLTVDSTVEVAEWYQTNNAQFLSNDTMGISVVNDSVVVDIVENSEALIVYGGKTDTLIKYRFWDGLSWSSPVNGPNVDSEIYWSMLSAGNIRDEYVALTLTADGDVNALVYTASSTSWSNQTELVDTVNTPNNRGIAVAHESVSGDALAVMCNAGADPVYSVWNGNSWSATSTLDAVTTSNCNWLSLAADPTSDEMILVIQPAAGATEAWVWDGSAWGNSESLGRISNTNSENIAVTYEESGDQALVVTTDAGDNEFVYTTWNGVEWGTSFNVPVASNQEFEGGRLVRDVGTDRVGLCMVDNGTDIDAFIWDGDAWGTEAELDPSTESNTSRTFDCEFETAAGRDGNFLVAYSDNNAAGDEYQYFDGSWSGPLDLNAFTDAWWIQTVRTGDGTILAAAMDNVGIDPLNASVFNGTSWSAATLLEANPSEGTIGSETESFAMAAKRFSFAQGAITTRPVDFDSVSGQPTWGDVSFNTTEPVGTSISVRVKYSDAGVCDAYIPNGTLAGNDDGFTAADQPVDISGLSTSTYNQICLEATIERSGEVSASLNDWSVSWVRQPKLIQNEYRWYVNSSALTPTDPWPLGILDVTENTALDATEALSINDTIRLRLSLEGLNIDLPQLSETFKLQYATGLTCSPTLDWNDVGEIGSSTALWRGYENSVVGSDWYDADWERRIKITVDDTLVNENLTDFPVYVDLDDLPDGFFVSVQNDGDDIRITESDGLTELPYELVSIDTSARTGELHFKADVSSTTDSEFYIYYANASASGYADSATFGSENVWTNGYDLRYALDDNPTGSSPQFKDSTDNDNNAVTRGTSGMTAGDVVTGQIGQAINLDGDDGAFFQSILTYTGQFSISMWWRTENLPDSDGFAIASADVGANEKIGPWNSPSAGRAFLRVRPGGSSDTTVTHPADASWTHVTVTRNASDKVDVHFNGTRSRLYGDVAQSGASNWHNFGGDPAQGFEGDLDELRFASVSRTSGWVLAEYYNQGNPTGFYDVSSEELISDGRSLPSTVLSNSDYPETYEEESPTRENQNLIMVGDNAEWDFVLQNNAAVANTNYCFRMVYADGAVLSSYNRYPRLITNAAPLETELIAPFDNEQTASSSPWFDFAASDELNDLVSYEIEIDTDVNFGSPDIARESNADFSQFENLSAPAERGLYTSGQIVRFIPNATLSNNTTYWWRVRARDDEGSGQYGEWASPKSFTIDSTTVITTWYQTTEEQFNGIDLVGATVDSSGEVGITSPLSAATVTGTPIEFADVDSGNAWGELRFTDNESPGDIKYSLEYLISGTEWELIPDSVLSGNAAGFDTTGVSLALVDPVTYHTLRIRATLTGNSALPRLQSWSLLWGQRIEPPVHEIPFDNAKIDDTTPTLVFSATDPQGDVLEYEVQVSETSDFTASTTYVSGIDAGFENRTTPADTSPFTSGEVIEYEFQSALNDNTTYWWRVRARDPLPGENAYSDWSTAQSFTVDTLVDVSTWHQTTGDQFATGELENIDVTAGEAEITSTIRGAMVAYGESTSFLPRYRLWDGAEWSVAQSALTVGALIEYAEVRAAPTRSEYALATLGSDADVSIQIFNANTSTWGNLFVLYTDIINTSYQGMDIAYETVSGELLAVSCDGQDAVYSSWNGSGWSATSSLALTKAENCEFIRLTSDPQSNEIIAVFRQTDTAGTDYEAWVWNGSSWGNATAFGENGEAENEGIGAAYETSGNQFVVAVPDGTNNQFFYNTWNGSSWSGAVPQALQNDFENGVIKSNPASDELVLCYIDEEDDMGTLFWNGAAWDTFSEFSGIGNDKNGGRPVSCEFETTSGREGYLVIPHAGDFLPSFDVYATSSYDGVQTISGLDITQGAWTVETIRTADNLVMTVFLKDAGNAPSRSYLFTYWDGSTWQGQQLLSGAPSVTSGIFHDSISMAAQISPSFTNGEIRSTPIEFADGGSPRFEQFYWNDVTPGGSSITYRLYYESAPGVFTLIPDLDLAGNAAGFTTGPIDLSALDVTSYETIQLEAELACASGDCPTLEDWTVEWSSGITISGLAFEYDQTTAMASGTVAVAINGVLQSGKTADLSNGFTTLRAIYDTAATSTFTVPTAVTEVSVQAWGAGGGGGAGGAAEAGGAGGGGGYAESAFTTTPGEDLTVRVGGGGGAGEHAVPAGAGGGGGLSSVYRTSTPLVVTGGGGGGGGGAGGVHFVATGTGCGVNNASCTPTVPAGTAEHDVLVMVAYSEDDTVHSCTANCTGWTEFSTQAGTTGRLSVWYLRRGGSAPANPTFSGPTTEFTAKMWAFRGVARTGNPYDVIGTNVAEPDASPFTGDSLTSTVDDVMTVFVGGSINDNTWGPASGACSIPGGVDADFYNQNLSNDDNSVFLCYDGTPNDAPGPLGVPSMPQAANGPDPGASFTFTLRPATDALTDAGGGGVGGGTTGGAGTDSGSATGGSGGTQSAGGAAGGGSASAGSALRGGAGGTGTGGGVGGAGGAQGGGVGGTGDSLTAEAGGGGGGAGYYGGGGGEEATGSTVSGAGGGGGSSYIDATGTATSTASGSGTVSGGNGESNYASGFGAGGTGGAQNTNGIAGGTGRVVISWTGTSTAGSWSIPNVNVTAGDVVTVFVTGADGVSEAVAVTKYDGAGDITGMELHERHLTLGSEDVPTISNADIDVYQNSDNEDVFFSVSSSILNLCVEATCTDSRLRILSGTTYQPGANSTLVNFENLGTFVPQSNSIRVSGAWEQYGTFTTGASTIIFTATTSSFIIDNATTSLQFHNVTFGETSGTATWSVVKPIVTSGTFAVDRGTFSRGTSSISVAGNLRLGNGGSVSGIGTTTFNGSGSNTWTDQNATPVDIGYAVVDGTAKTVTLGSNVTAQTVTIGSDDTLNASGSGYNLNVYRQWVNNNAFIPQSGTVTFIGTSTGSISRGASSFNNVTFSGVGGTWSFTTPTLALNGTMTIATGTVTLPTGTTTIAGSFTNSGGTFLHNNGEVRMTSTAGGRTITQGATPFLNNFNDIVFTGTGAWSFTETRATTTGEFRITAGTVTFPSTQLTVGEDFLVTGTGAFAHNNGEVTLLVQDASDVRANGSSFNNLRTVGVVSGSWYNDAWEYRLPITINESQVDGDLTNFPVHVDLDDLGSHFFTNVKVGGGDIRLTQSDGITEVPRELVSINTAGTDGELYFRANLLSSTTNTTFYLYYGNAAASEYAVTDTYGARNVWSNGYALVAHLNDLTTSTVVNSAGTINGTKTSANNPLFVTTGYIYGAQDVSGDSIQFAGDIIGGDSQYSVSMWFNPDALTGGNADQQSFGYSLYGVSESGAPYQWLRAGGTGFSSELRLCAYDNGTACNATTGAGLTTGAWNYVSISTTISSNTTIRVNGVQRLSFTNPGNGPVSNNFTIGDLRPTRNINFDGRIDEVRVSTVVRTNAWRDAEYRNTATSTNFYTAGGVESGSARTFTDTNATILGNFTLDAGGDSIFPTGVLSIGGSLTNNAEFDANSGTVRFNSTAGSETIDAGDSSFATLDFNSVTGNFTITENATATVAISLTNASQFTLASGRTLLTQGTFTNAIANANTTWTGATLVLAGNNDITTSAKTYAGDTYNILRTEGTTIARLWNSTAATYSTAATSSIYSQDHAAIDGDLYIYGNYTRTTGTEHWSWGTDFDGVTLPASTSRQVDVRIATSSQVGFINSSLRIVGAAGATTTIDAQTGAFGLNATNTTLTAQYFNAAGTNVNGFGLYASSTISTFSDGFFTVAPGRIGVTFDNTTINNNPSAQFFRIGFATTTAGSATNARVSGATSNFVWFRDGTGNLYGEAYDGADANPGSLRFDDSSNSITISGVVYADDGVTPLGAPTCNGVTPNVRVVVNNASYTASTSCNASTGAYSLTGVNYIGDPKVTVYLNTNGGTRGTVVTKTPTADITNMHIYANRVIVRHQDITALTVADMVSFTNTDDSDIPFIATTTPASSLTLLPNTELYVFAGNRFAPGGNITLTGNANNNSYEGTLQIGPGATFTAQGAETHTLAGRMVLGTGSTFTPASSTVVFNATTTGKSISAPATVSFNNITFAGTGGGWNIGANLSVAGDMAIASGTVTGTGNITLTNGDISGDGLLSMGGGTVTLQSSNTLGGSTPWTFNNLTVGNGSTAGTTTPSSVATTTILGVFTIAGAHVYDAGAGTIDLQGTGSVFTESGQFREGTGTVVYSGASANVLRTPYYNLTLNAAGTGTYTAPSIGLLIQNNLSIGASGSSTLNLTTNDPVTAVSGNVLIGSSGTLAASDSASLTIGGNWTNAGTFTANGGTVTFTPVTAAVLTAGSSSFSSLTVTGAGALTVTENATTTNQMSISSSTTFTLDSGRVLAVGNRFLNDTNGSNTTWTGSTLALYGGNQYEVNTKTGEDTYDTVVLTGSAQPRVWGSAFGSVVTSGNGSLYSMDHAGTVGDLYIYGDYENATYSDYWSYENDFDGAVLGSPRTASVFVQSGGAVTYLGGSLSVIGSTTATTTVANQGSGTYSFTVGGTTTVNMSYVEPRDLVSAGITFVGTPTVGAMTNIDWLIQQNSASAMTVDGTVIEANPAKNLNRHRFEADIGVTGAINVSFTGSSVSSWRFTNEYGNRAGEGFDVDSGDPGEIVWTDSAALITISGRVYSDEGSVASGVCDGVTGNIRIVVAGLTSASTTCDGTGFYEFTGVGFSPADSIIVYIDGESEKAATVTYEPLSNITNMDLYENRLIVRHEGAAPISIAELAVWDSSDDADIPFTADISGSPDTLSLPANRKLLIWNNKDFDPNGNVTVTGGGVGDAWDGTFEARAGAEFIAANGEVHTIGGSFVFGAGATFTSAQSTVVLTTTGAARTIDTNEASFHNLTLTGSGSWSIPDATLTINGDYSQTNGTVAFPTGTTTLAGSFSVTGSGSLNSNTSPFIFTSTATGKTVRFNGANVNDLTFSGTGGAWSLTDTSATSTGALTITAGTVTLPSGTLTLAGSLDNQGGTITHNSGTVRFILSTDEIIRARGSDLGTIVKQGTGELEMIDTNLAIRGDLIVSGGNLIMASGTVSIARSLDVNGGSFAHSSGTILFNGSTGGNIIDSAGSDFYNLSIGAPTGGYSLFSATTTNNLSLTGAATFAAVSGETVRVSGVFLNQVANSNTTWTNTTLVLGGNQAYSINTKANSGDFYETLIIESGSDIRQWHTRATTTLVASDSSLYSQDHAAVNGALAIYGDFAINAVAEHWSYATDFDGIALTSGNERAVTVAIAANATTTLTSGSLTIEGVLGNETDVTHQGSGTYAFTVSGGTFDASYYTFDNLNVSGLVFSGTPTLNDLSNGYFELAVNGGSLITVSSTTLNANASKIFDAVGFNAVSLTGSNVTLLGSTDSFWRFTNSYGNLDGENFDADGDACGSLRWDDSACLLTEQTAYRWRNNDGGLGVPSAEWFDTDWLWRKRVRVTNESNQTYTNTAVKVPVTYEAAMQTNFSDLRFTTSDGVTEVPYWIERATASTDAQIWVTVPSLATSSQAVIHMYYGNAAATTTTSDGDAVFSAFDDYEDNNISEYSGDTSLFTTVTTPVFGATYALRPSNTSGKTTDGIFRFDEPVAQGQIIRYMQYVDTVSGTGDEPCTLFGVQSPGTTNLNYGVCLEQFGVDRISLARDVDNNDTSGVVLATSSVTYTTGWYEVEIDWQTNNSISVSLYNPSGTLVTTVSTTNGTYTSGGYGYAFWFQNGAWDSFTARPRSGPVEVSVGAAQQIGGATWRSALNSFGGGIPGETLRLRIAIENTGLEVENQQYRLEYAPKSTAPSCEAVLPVSYITVPNQASCGSSPVCMQTTAEFNSGDATTDLLFGTNGTFVSGKAVESPDSQSTNQTIPQNNFTELEYAVTPTINASDSYCFRVTNAGTPIDSYNAVAELGLQFDPFLDPVTLNNAGPITLLPGTTTPVFATTTVTDFNGYTDIVVATTTFYRGGALATSTNYDVCIPDDNNCYITTLAGGGCTLTLCSGDSCVLECQADIFFHADPTDDGTYAGEEWFAFMEVEDQASGYDFETSFGQELTTLRAIDVAGAIDYGALAVSDDTGAFNPATSVYNLGNVEIDIEVLGTDLSDGVSSFIPAEQQKFATSTFTYTSCGVTCNLLSSTTPVSLDLNLTKPAAETPPVEDTLYWGISVPFGVNSVPHQGYNVFTPVSP